MKQTLVFATNNLHKLEEIRQILAGHFNVKSLIEVGINEDLPENQTTLEGNALEKASFVYEKLKADCFADDTGLEIEALNGDPGVFSARYAGAKATFDDNVNKVLALMGDKPNRKAAFRTVIALFYKNKKYLFDGRVDGFITAEKSGDKGFGYDPIFRPNNSQKTFAEMSAEDKNSISHRALAIQKLAEFFKKTTK